MSRVSDTRPLMSIISLQSRATSTGTVVALNTHQDVKQLKENLTVMPVGTLAVLIKKIHVLSMDTRRVFGRNEITVYVRMSLGSSMKYSPAFQHLVAPFSVSCESVWHFFLQPGDKSVKNLELQLCGFNPEKPVFHTVLCSSRLNIFDIIYRTVASRTLRMRAEEAASNIIAEMEIEHCFQYGFFGYGISNQFRHSGRTPQDQLTVSLFFRSEPRDDRNDILNDILKCTHVGHPKFIPFRQKTEISSVTQDFADEIRIHKHVSQIKEPVLFSAKIRERFKQRQDELQELPNAKERINYLQQLILNKDQHSDIGGNNFALTPKFEPQIKSLAEAHLTKKHKFMTVSDPQAEGRKLFRRHLSTLVNRDTKDKTDRKSKMSRVPSNVSRRFHKIADDKKRYIYTERVAHLFKNKAVMLVDATADRESDSDSD